MFMHHMQSAFACWKADWCAVIVPQAVTADMTFFPFVLIDANSPAYFDVLSFRVNFYIPLCGHAMYSYARHTVGKFLFLPAYI